MENKIGKISSILVSFVMVATVFVIAVPLNVKAPVPTTWYVDDVPGSSGPDDPPEDFTYIQYAIDAANPGDTIYVYSGMYHADRIDFYKNDITLEGENNEDTIIETEGEGVWMSSVSGIKITNLKIMGAVEPTISMGFCTDITIIGNNLIGQGDESCIDYVYSSYITINGNTISVGGPGILSQQSSNNIISGNNFVDNGAGIHLSYSSDNTISGNIFSGGWGIADIQIWRSISNTFTNNILSNSGIHIEGPLIEHWNTHTIATTNMVNGRPIHYLKDVSGGTIPLGAGQVILANCNNVVVENQEISDLPGILLGFSSGNTIRNNNPIKHMNLYYSDGNTIVGNTVIDHILLYYSNSNTINKNTVTGTSFSGITIYLSFSNGNTISENTVSYGSTGIHLLSSSGNTISCNTASTRGNGFGISLAYSSSNTVSGNACTDSRHGIYINAESNYNLITRNVMENNVEYGIIIKSSNNNQVYNNDFINNLVHAYVLGGSGNLFNLAAPTGGNYWADYTGVDLDDDGFYDDPFIFTGGQDDLPWVTSFLYTPTGPDVDIYPDPDVSMTFDDITESGTTTVTTSTTNPGEELVNFKFIGSYYNITTTATFSGDITITLSYDDTGIPPAQEANLRLKHWDGTAWIDVTTSIDTVNNIVYGLTNSLSPFVLGYEVTPVEIDIKPGSEPNSINLGSEGNVPLAILTTSDFDATDVNPESVSLAGASVGLKGKSNKLMASIKDVDNDGDDDLMLHIDIEELELLPGSTIAILNGFTYSDIEIKGIDTVNIVPA
jgi:parallel beta-helix repeat protein